MPISWSRSYSFCGSRILCFPFIVSEFLDGLYGYGDEIKVVLSNVPCVVLGPFAPCSEHTSLLAPGPAPGLGHELFLSLGLLAVLPGIHTQTAYTSSEEKAKEQARNQREIMGYYGSSWAEALASASAFMLLIGLLCCCLSCKPRPHGSKTGTGGNCSCDPGV
nr:hypothetical protein CDL12_14398 [Ipomoea batatas]